jgi:4'-phosphopantetheinyl transferase
MGGSLRNAGLAENSVAVFYTRVLRPSPEQIESLAKSLTAEEIQQASRFVFAKDRELYISAHALLRFCLSSAGCDSRQNFKVGEYGKPELDPPDGTPPLHFNLSHTNGLAACALARGHEVGIDVEEINRRLDFEAITRRAFAPEEQKLLADSSPGEQPDIFFRLWVLKEAIIKGIGRGLALPTADFVFQLDPLSLAIAASAGERSADWQIQELVPTASHRLAVAARRTSQTNLSVTCTERLIATLVEWSNGAAADTKTVGSA